MSMPNSRGIIIIDGRGKCSKRRMKWERQGDRNMRRTEGDGGLRGIKR